MLQLTPQSRILLALAPVDFRKGIDGLGADSRDSGHSRVPAPPERMTGTRRRFDVAGDIAAEQWFSGRP